MKPDLIPTEEDYIVYHRRFVSIEKHIEATNDFLQYWKDWLITWKSEEEELIMAVEIVQRELGNSLKELQDVANEIKIDLLARD